MFALRLFLAFILLGLGGAGPARALEVDLALVLAVDVSRSVDDDEAKLQRDGYISALTDPKVVEAVKSGPLGRVAIVYVEWAGAEYQRTIVDWTVIDGADAAHGFASRLAEAPRVGEMWTSISAGLLYSAALIEKSGFDAKRKVIDVSGDGRNNNGPDIAEARQAVLSRGIVINGLPIVNERPNFGRPAERDLDIYYEQNVIGGPGSFMIAARDFPDFARAIRTKLIKEIAGTAARREGGVAALP